MDDQKIKEGRRFLQNYDRDEINYEMTDQKRGVAMPPVEKSIDRQATVIDLPPAEAVNPFKPFLEIIENRRSQRAFSDKPLPLKDLSFLLHCTTGIRKQTDTQTFRHVPSSGNRHPFESYLVVQNVADLRPAIYRYLPTSHQLVLVREVSNLPGHSYVAARRQAFVKRSAVNFIWTCLPYRTEWRADRSAHKVIAIDAGHLCQNLYLACEALGHATCAIAAYDQTYCDRLLAVDGKDEFVIYMSAVGRAVH